MNINNIKWVICFGSDLNSPSKFSTWHLIKKFHDEGKKILWINPVPFRNLRIKNQRKASFIKKITNKIITHIHLIRKIKKGFYNFSPLYVPNVEDDSVRNFNKKLIKIQFKLLLRIFRINQYLIWIAGSLTGNAILIEEKSIIVYQAADFISDFRDASEGLRNFLRTEEKKYLLKQILSLQHQKGWKKN